MANELEQFVNDEIENTEAVAEERVELDEFKASGENSEVAEPVAKGSNKRPADKTAGFVPPAPGGASEKSGSESKGEDLITAKGSKAPARKADKAVSDSPKAPSVSTPGQGGSVKEDIDAIFGEEELSEELREKAETVFSAAVNARVAAIEEQYSEAFNVQLAEAKEQLTEELTGKVDDYMNYIAEEWMKENAVAVESSLKVEVAESFMTGLKGLMEAHNIAIPEETQPDVVEELKSKVEELEAKLEEETVSKVNISKELSEAQCKVIFSEVTEDLAETQIEKIRALSEGLDYDNTEDYSKKLNMLKESYFGSKPTPASVEDEEPVELDEEVKLPQGEMAHYAAAISRTVRK